MSKKKMKINIDGFGEFSVKLPTEYNKETVEQTILTAVLQTLNMMNEAKGREIFHPAMGMKTRDNL